jgi:parallel beta-helix repeat protein
MLAFNVEPVEGWTGTVYIRSDGSIDPPDAPIMTYDNITYTLIDNITGTAHGIVVERSNITIDGAGYTLQGSGSGNGIWLNGVQYVTIKNVNIKEFAIGILLFDSSNYNIISGNNITANSESGIYFYMGCSNNRIFGNNIADNVGTYSVGIKFGYSSDNSIYHNNFVNNRLNVYSVGSMNVWDDGYPTGGNYWSDYDGADFYGGPFQNETGSDGIGDIPYIIDEHNQDSYPLMNPLVDLAVVGVMPSVTEVYVGQFVNITVVVMNEGRSAETFSVTVYYNNASMGTQTIVGLGSGENVTLVFLWDTKDVAPGNYTIKALVSILPNEINTSDNTMISPFTIKIKMLGDVNGDNVVDIRDIALAALAFGSYPDHPKWNSQADVNQDNVVDIIDLALIAINFGRPQP